MGFEPTTFCMASGPSYCHLQPWAATYPDSGTTSIAGVAACCPPLPSDPSIGFSTGAHVHGTLETNWV
jgi:hypothetical protein